MYPQQINQTYTQATMDAQNRKSAVVNRLRAKLAKKEVEKKHMEAYEQYRTIAKENAYEAYCESIKEQNKKHGTKWKPHPITDFQWKQCCLCGNTIADDPYGHNPFPLCEVDDYESKACGRCNSEHIITARIVCMRENLGSPEEARESCRPLEAELRASYQR